MEDTLEKIIKECSSIHKYTAVSASAQKALDVLEAYAKAPETGYRRLCLEVLRASIEVGTYKMISLTSVILFRMSKDNRFHTKRTALEENEDEWMCSQVLSSIRGIESLSDADSKLEILKGIIAFSNHYYWQLNGRLTIQIISLCIDLYWNNNANVRSAAQSLCSVNIKEFCKQTEHIIGDELDQHNEVIPIFQFVCSKLEEILKPTNGNQSNSINSSASEVPLLIESLHSLVSSVSSDVVKSPHFVEFIQQKFSAIVLSYLGFAILSSSSDSSRKQKIKVFVRLDHQSCRTMFLIAMHMVYLIGPVFSLRPVLESNFHKLLIDPKIKDRLGPITAVTDMLTNPQNLVYLFLALIQEENECETDGMAIFKLLIKSLEECCGSEETMKDFELVAQSLDCLRSLLRSLNKVIYEGEIDDLLKEKILELYPQLVDADYKGPLCYDSEKSLPQAYQEMIKKEKESIKSENSLEVSDEEAPIEDGNEVSNEVCDGSIDIDKGIVGSDISDNISEDTEGPEEGFDNDEELGSIDNFISHENDKIEELRLKSRRIIPKSLQCIEDNEAIDPDVPKHLEEELRERENAKIFIKDLKDLITQDLSRGSTVEIDSLLQKFASEFCIKYSNYSPETHTVSSNPGIIMNADGIYLTSYLALHLSMSMALNGDFKKQEEIRKYKKKEEFLKNILESGLLVYLSSNWLSKVYDIVVEYDVFGFSLYDFDKGHRHILFPILSDLDGFSSTKNGSQLLSEYCRLSRGETKKKLDKTDALKRISRRIITTIWGSILSLLNKSLDPYIEIDGNSKSESLFSRGNKIRRRKRNETLLSTGIECLEYALELCSVLELHDRCGSILAPLTSLVMSGANEAVPKKRKLRAKSLQIIEKILTDGIELGSQSQDCWKHVLKCVTHILSMEKAYDIECTTKSSEILGNALSYPMGKRVEHLTIVELLNERKVGETAFIGTLSHDLSSACLKVLIPKIDQFFDDGARKLNLHALIGFLSELCFCSHKELLTVFPNRSRKVRSSKNKLKWQSTSNQSNLSSKMSPDSRVYDDLLMHKIGDVMLKCIKSGRPLIHIVRSWAIVGPHFMEIACQGDHLIAKKAVQHIHDITTAFLQNISELPYFNFNEAVFKPFENIVCLELCDMDVQDQVVSSICEFVESYTGDIRSGWRPLFGTLKAVQFSLVLEEDIAHMRAVLDVFNAFLCTDSPDIFANAALDCVGCLIKHINGKEAISNKNSKNLGNDNTVSTADQDLTKVVLQYILRCHDMFFMIYDMPCRPVFHGAHKIRVPEIPLLVDSALPHFEVYQFDESRTNTLLEFGYSFESLLSIQASTNLLISDDPQRLLRVWYLLLDGLTNAVTTIPKEHQSASVDTLFEILNSFVDKDVEFGLYSANHLLLPMLQTWLRRSQRTFQGWVESGPNFKHCVGKTTELVLKWLKSRPQDLLVLKQLLLLLVECTVVPVEGIARLGCACFRHILLTRASELTKEQWTIVVLSLCRAGQLSLYPLHQIMVPFYRGSSNFYGDIGSVKIAARRDSCRKESHRLQLLAQQVLLLDQQQGDIPKLPECPDMKERSFLFLLTPPGKEEEPDSMYRVTLRSLLTGLAAHDIILQILGGILLQGTKHVVPSLTNIVLSKPSPPQTPSMKTGDSKAHLPGMLEYLSSTHIKMLLEFLKITTASVMEFDSRPGLKFLVQKVAQLKNAANLYKQAGAAWSLSTVSTFEIVVNTIRRDGTTADQVRKCLEKHHKNINTLEEEKIERDINADENKIERDSSNEEDVDEYFFFLHLHDSFLEICETYVDIAMDKDGQRAKTDELVRQPLYFFSFEADDFYEITQSPSDETLEPENQDNEDDVFSKNGDKPPFRFSDFRYALEEGAEGSVGSEEVFRVATQVEMNTVLNEFRYRKGKRSLPSTSSDGNGRTRKNPFNNSSNCSSLSKGSTDSPSVDPDIACQQKESLMRDSEAQIKVWSELVVVLLDLSKQLEDEEYKVLLPLLFPGVKALAAHAQDAVLKQEVADVFVRVGNIFGFNLE